MRACVGCGCGRGVWVDGVCGFFVGPGRLQLGPSCARTRTRNHPHTHTTRRALPPSLQTTWMSDTSGLITSVSAPGGASSAGSWYVRLCCFGVLCCVVGGCRGGRGGWVAGVERRGDEGACVGMCERGGFDVVEEKREAPPTKRNSAASAARSSDPRTHSTTHTLPPPVGMSTNTSRPASVALMIASWRWRNDLLPK